jgi:hypothetical protein
MESLLKQLFVIRRSGSLHITIIDRARNKERAASGQSGVRNALWALARATSSTTGTCY